MDLVDSANKLYAHKPKRTASKIRQLRITWVALSVCFLGLLSFASYSFSVLRQGARNASCRNDVFMLKIGLLEYAVDHDGLLPPISTTRGNLMIDPEGFYPTYLSNSCWLQCEWSDVRPIGSSGNNSGDLGVSAFNDNSFCYLPWALRNEEEGLAFIEAYRNMDLKKRKEGLPVEIGGEQRILPRIQFSPDVLSEGGVDDPPEVPIAVEWPDKFHTNGSVLYTNGWIRTMELGEEFPMTEDFIAGLRDIAALDPNQ